mmetsp:Transcript_43446/g.113095  ORF Transcript_43446/g.113095 Transcript_43446/m.113095 type:complete len:129 (-) Transcript_43446:2028-2414(-)
MAESEVPLISIKPYLEGDAEGSKKVIEQIKFAGEKVGFMMICDHGVPQDIIDENWKATRVRQCLLVCMRPKTRRRRRFCPFILLSCFSLFRLSTFLCLSPSLSISVTLTPVHHRRTSTSQERRKWRSQ